MARQSMSSKEAARLGSLELAFGSRGRSYLMAVTAKHRKVRKRRKHWRDCSRRAEGKEPRPRARLGRLGEGTGEWAGSWAEEGSLRAETKAGGEVVGSRRVTRSSPSWCLAFSETNSPWSKLTDLAPLAPHPFIPPSSHDISLLIF